MINGWWLVAISILKRLNKKVNGEKQELNYLRTVDRIVKQMGILQNEHNLAPKYIVLGYKNYLELLLHMSQKVYQRPHSIIRFMDCDVVVVPGKDLVEVVPDALNYIGVRTS